MKKCILIENYRKCILPQGLKALPPSMPWTLQKQFPSSSSESLLWALLGVSTNIPHTLSQQHKVHCNSPPSGAQCYHINSAEVGNNSTHDKGCGIGSSLRATTRLPIPQPLYLPWGLASPTHYLPRQWTLHLPQYNLASIKLHVRTLRRVGR